MCHKIDFPWWTNWYRFVWIRLALSNGILELIRAMEVGITNLLGLRLTNGNMVSAMVSAFPYSPVREFNCRQTCLNQHQCFCHWQFTKIAHGSVGLVPCSEIIFGLPNPNFIMTVDAVPTPWALREVWTEMTGAVEWGGWGWNLTSVWCDTGVSEIWEEGK